MHRLRGRLLPNFVNLDISGFGSISADCCLFCFFFSDLQSAHTAGSTVAHVEIWDQILTRRWSWYTSFHLQWDAFSIKHVMPSLMASYRKWVTSKREKKWDVTGLFSGSVLRFVRFFFLFECSSAAQFYSSVYSGKFNKAWMCLHVCARVTERGRESFLSSIIASGWMVQVSHCGRAITPVSVSQSLAARSHRSHKGCRRRK